MPDAVDQPDSSPPRPGRFVLVSFAALCLFLALVVLDLRPPPAVRVSPVAAAHAPLTAHLALVVLDGVRYDLAVDPARAPNLARHLRDDAHGEVWAGEVTMTSAAVLTLGSGARGDYAQIMFNLAAAHAEGNDLFANAHAAKMTTALAGDGTWNDVFGAFDREALSPTGVSWEVDDSEEILTAAAEMARSASPPNILVVHVLAPDHQGHAYGVASEKYAAHLRALDARVESFLASLPASFTVAVMSDHGAEDDGSHGVDAPLERRCPFFAYGPGVRAHVDLGRVDQVDLASTFAALLGLPSPAHGRGIADVDLLDLDDDGRAAIACNDAVRVALLADASNARSFRADEAAPLATCANGSPRDRIEAARSVVRAWDREVTKRAERRGLVDAGGVAIALAGYLAIAFFLIVGRGALLAVPVAALVAAGSVALTWLVDHERLPFTTRAIVSGIFALAPPLLAAMVPPLRRRAAPLCALSLAALAASFPRDTKTFALYAVGVALLFVYARAYRERVLDLGHAFLAVAGSVALLWTARGGVVVQDPPFPRLALPLCAVLLAAYVLVSTRSDRLVDRIAAIVLPAASPFLRDVVAWPIGLSFVVAFACAAIAFARLRRPTVAVAFALAAYGLLSRDPEILSVVAAVLVARGAGKQARSPIVLAIVVFGALFLARVGVQRGLEFTTIDLHAGVFDDPRASFARTAACVCAKYALVAFAISLAAVVSIEAERASRTLRALVVAFVARAGVMALTLFACRGSFWSSQRALSELPCAILVALGPLVVFFFLGQRERAA